MPIFALTLLLAAAAEPPRTMRLDYFHTGTATEERFSLDGVAPRAAAEALGREGIFVWDGDFYATGLIERLGKAEVGGVLRLGLVHYNTADEVDRTLEALGRVLAAR